MATVGISSWRIDFTLGANHIAHSTGKYKSGPPFCCSPVTNHPSNFRHIDFMQKHGLVLDFTTIPVTIHSQTMSINCQPDVQPLLNAMKKTK